MAPATDVDVRSASERTFATPELMEHILSFLIDKLHQIRYGEDPRSVKTYKNADWLLHLLHCSEVNRTWNHGIRGSKVLQRALFLEPDQRQGRNWDVNLPKSSVIGPHLQAPVLNPIIQTIFKAYHFRYWHLSLEASNNKYTAYLIITRRDLPDLGALAKTGQGRTISRMLLSQPPCTALDSVVWGDRDETRDYVGRTTTLRDSRIYCEDGLTLEIVHDRVAEMFEEHPDVVAIKLVTM